MNDPRSERLRRLAWLLDESIPLPGGFRVGLDGVIGLVPVLGDLFGAWATSSILWEARRAGAPRSLMLRMAGNLLLDMALGLVPVLGDVFDFGFKANSRNLRLLLEFQQQPARSQASSRLFVVALIALLLSAMLGLLLLGVAVVNVLAAALGAG